MSLQKGTIKRMSILSQWMRAAQNRAEMRDFIEEVVLWRRYHYHEKRE